MNFIKQMRKNHRLKLKKSVVVKAAKKVESINKIKSRVKVYYINLFF